MTTAFLTHLPLTLPTSSNRRCGTTQPTPHPRPRTRRARMTISPPEKHTIQSEAATIPSAFDWRNQWYPIIWTDDITTAPHAFTIFGKPLVAFRDSAVGNVVVMDDVCPHRAARLSSGMLHETDSGTQITCGYHGWRFDARGFCTDIPYTERVPRSACIEKVYPTTQWNGLVFVWFGDNPPDDSLLPIPGEFREWGDDVLWFRNMRRRLPVSFIPAVENVLDPAHVNWVHHNTGHGHRSRIPRDAGIDSEWSAAGDLISKVIAGNGNRDYRVTITLKPPTSVFYVAPFGFLLFAWHRPINHDECEMFSLNGWVNPTTKLRLSHMIAPRWRQCSVGNMILDGDGVIMQDQTNELQRRNRDGYGASWKEKFRTPNGSWDTAVREYRQFIDINAVGMPWNCIMTDNTPALTERQINNRLIFHTKDCTACSGALKWASRLLWTAVVGMALGAVLVVSTCLVRACGVVGNTLLRAGVMGMSLCLLSGILGVLMMKMRKSLTYTTKAYDLAH